ncbi:MAG TPA: ATP-binding protein, partial [Candidatus Saccharimonas sp.]|nr:ATP-binding protein [Candidatus Saccharimonas sp.]
LHVTSPLGKLPEVYADQSKVHQVLFNLVDNAIKFTDQGGVTIKAKVEDGHLRFFVIDTGKGMSEEAQRLLFHKFQQGADDLLTRDNTQGTGLGLYISKLILERMGGSIKLEYSEAHNGTAFSCSLPLADAKPAEPKSGTQPPATP